MSKIQQNGTEDPFMQTIFRRWIVELSRAFLTCKLQWSVS